MRKLALCLLLVGCGNWNRATVLGGNGAGGAGSGSGGGGLPCDLAQLLSAQCQSCHSSPPSGGAPMSMISYADLIMPAPSDPNQRVIDVAIARMQDAARPMPPTGLLAASDVALLQNWVSSGYPMGTCGGNGANTPTVCTSGSYVNAGEGSTMAPGMACISCHSSGEGPRFLLAGTLYPTAHEPDDCSGGGSGIAGAVVEITDANGMVYRPRIYSSGNFYLSPRSASGFAMPFRAKVTRNGAERAMSAAQADGDCNGCHTVDGANGAPGRIFVP